VDPLKVISAAHRQVRTAALDDQMTMALRMNEEFTEGYLKQMTEDEIKNPFAQLRSPFEADMAAERSFNMTMAIQGRASQGMGYVFLVGIIGIFRHKIQKVFEQISIFEFLRKISICFEILMKTG